MADKADAVSGRFGYDGSEGIWFDREKPTGESCPERGKLYEEVETDEIIAAYSDSLSAMEIERDARHPAPREAVEALIEEAEEILFPSEELKRAIARVREAESDG